jgi:hypothetical protein
VNGDHKTVHLDKNARRTLTRRANYVPGIINVVQTGSSSATVASLVLNTSNAAAPVFMASPHNASEVRLTFIAPDDFAVAGMNQSTMSVSEVPVRVRAIISQLRLKLTLLQIEVDAFNPISAVTGALGSVVTALCGTLGGPLDAVLSSIGLALCPADAKSMSEAQTFAYDIDTGMIRHITSATSPTDSGEPGASAMKLVFVPTDVPYASNTTNVKA